MFASLIPLSDCEQLVIAEEAADIALAICKLILRSSSKHIRDSKYAVITRSTCDRVHLTPITYTYKPVYAVVYCTSNNDELIVVANTYDHNYHIELKFDFSDDGTCNFYDKSVYFEKEHKISTTPLKTKSNPINIPSRRAARAGASNLLASC